MFEDRTAKNDAVPRRAESVIRFTDIRISKPHFTDLTLRFGHIPEACSHEDSRHTSDSIVVNAASNSLHLHV